MAGGQGQLTHGSVNVCAGQPGGSLNIPIIVGAAAGGVLLVVAVAAAMAWRRRRRPRHPTAQAHASTPPAAAEELYAHRQAHFGLLLSIKQSFSGQG